MNERNENLESLARMGVVPTEEELAAVGLTVEQYHAEYLSSDPVA